MNECFRYLVIEARKRGKEVIDRCNLTVLLERGHEDLVDFLHSHNVHIVASLPCYSSKNVDKQRGQGVFGKSIIALQLLNSVGYGADACDLKLDLVYNPNGPFLPPSQKKLEDDYKNRLMNDFGIKFNNLFTITNMPIKRYADQLQASGQLQQYMDLLVKNFNVAATSGLMCKNTVSVRWDGRIYDCDFNQQLDLGLLSTSQSDAALTAPHVAGASSTHCNSTDMLDVFQIDSTDELLSRDIKFGQHCFGCTAGAGSSCQGTTTES